MITSETPQTHINTPRQVLFASMVGTTVEFFDFYIYATAAVLVFPRLFFPASDPASSTLASLATFGIAFLARPIGSALFGHFGDRIGRKKTLVLALSTMGLSTFAIGALPAYHSIGIAAPLLLALCRFGQGIGLGGEWGGAVLLAVETPHPTGVHFTACSLNSVRPSASCSPEGPSSCSHAGSPTSSSSPSAGGCHSSQAPCWCFSGSMFA
jgi:hypothetical protein